MNKLNNKILLEEINKEIDRRYEKMIFKKHIQNQQKKQQQKKREDYIFICNEKILC